MFQRPCIIILLLLSSTLQAQTRYLSQAELNQVMNRIFGNLVTGKSNSGEVANYASLDPVGGSFTMKGNVPFGSDKTDSLGKISYLGITLMGDLMNSSYAALFNNSSLNTNVTIQGQFNFRAGRIRYSYSNADMAELNLKRALLRDDSALARETITRGLSASSDQLALLRDQQISNHIDSVNKGQTFAHFKASVDSLKTAANPSPATTALLKKGIDTLTAIDKSLQTLRDAVAKNQKQQDSLTIVIANKFNIRNYLEGQADADYKKKLDSLVFKAPLKAWHIGWFSIAGGVGRQKYNNFNAALPFSSQITTTKQTTNNISLAWNYYYINFLERHLLFLNAGVGRSLNNNAALFSTSEVDDTYKIVNSSGDTTRTVTKKYNVYTNPITLYTNWSAFANFYFLFGSRPSGIHLFPELDYRSDKLWIANAGIGYIISFLNSKSGQAAINAEAYVKFLDLGNQQRQSSTFWNRNEIGVSFTLPVNFLGN